MTSVVWKYFSKVDREENDDSNAKKAKCNTCSGLVSNTRSTTTNMMIHLENHHPQLHQEALLLQMERNPKSAGKKRPSAVIEGKVASESKKRQATLLEMQPFHTKSEKHRQITEAITRFISQDALPIYTVEKNGFKNMISVLTDKKYVLPSRKVFRDTEVPNLYNKVRKSILKNLSDVNHVAVTTDLWSSINTTPYLSFTIHYISSGTSEPWTLNTHVLETMYFPESHTGLNISEALDDTLARWNIDRDKVTSFTTDSASNMKLAISNLDLPRIPCFGHVLHNGVTYALSNEKVDSVVAKAREVCAKFSRSWKQQQLLKEAQQRLGLPERRIPADCKTRWGTKYKMLAAMIEQESAIEAVFSDRKNIHLVPSVEDFEVCWPKRNNRRFRSFRYIIH